MKKRFKTNSAGFSDHRCSGEFRGSLYVKPAFSVGSSVTDFRSVLNSTRYAHQIL